MKTTLFRLGDAVLLRRLVLLPQRNVLTWNSVDLRRWTGQYKPRTGAILYRDSRDAGTADAETMALALML